MSPPLSKSQMELLQKLYYDQSLVLGRDKIYQYIRTNHPDQKISRRQVMEWLSKQEVNQMTKPHEAPKDIKSTILKQPHQSLGIDLIDMMNFEQKGFKYMLNCVDLFSRKFYSVAMEDKTDKTTLTALKKVIKEIPDLKSIRSDNGSEFISVIMKDYLKKQGISQILSTAGNPQSNGNIERFNGTYKRMIHKQILLNPDYDWVKNGKLLVDNLNNTFVNGLNKTPNDIEKNYKEENTEFITDVMEKDIKKKKNNISTQKFYPRDKVRIYLPSDKMKSLLWSPDLYTIDNVYPPKKVFQVYEYKLKEVDGKYMEEDLQKINDVQNRTNQPELFTVSKIVRPTVKDNKKHYEVAWKNYRKKSDNTIEPLETLITDIPKMIGLYDKRNNVKWFMNGTLLKVSYDKKEKTTNK